MRIKRLEIKNWIGISEFAMNLGKINRFSGHKGSGKTSVVEALEKAFTNKNRRVEVIRHGADEARIFVQTDDDLEVERKVRDGKADYLKVRKQGESVPSTEAYLRKFISGEIFRPLEFVKKDPAEQARIILNMLEIPWTMDDIANWFGEIPKDVSYEAHILQVLKQIEATYYNQRESINREIKVLEAQVKGIKDGLPPNYDGEHWRQQKVSEYYGKVAEAQEVNRRIENAKSLIEGLENRIATIRAEAETDKQSKKNAFDRQRAENREFTQFLNQKIGKAETIITGAGAKLESLSKAVDQELELNIQKEESDYQEKLRELKAEYEEKVKAHRENAVVAKGLLKKNTDAEVTKANDDIAKCKNSLAAKEQELLNIDTLEEQALAAVDENAKQRIETENAKAGNAKTEAEKEPIDIEPLQKEANKVADMQSYLHDFDRMEDIFKTKLAPRHEQSMVLTARISKARELPMELLKIAAVPIPGITVDGEGRIRVDGTLLDGRSEGEQLDLALRMAKAQAGELGLICIDGISKINPSDRKWLEDEMATDDLQYVVLDTTEGNLNVEIEQGGLFDE